MNISSLQSTDFDEMLAHSSRIILYFHGNSGNRGVKYRVDFVKTLATQYDAHVITFDYRGFGDSTGWPISEEDTTTDAFAVLNWVESVLCKHGNGLSYLGCGNSIGGRTSDQCHKDKKLPFLYFYGHSLGSAVGVALAHKLKDSVPGNTTHSLTYLLTHSLIYLLLSGIITGLILDSPFTNFPDAALVHPVGAIFRIFPWVKSQINTSLMFRYPTIDRIHQLDTNIMFVHGTADKKVPITFSEQLYRKIMVNAYNSNKKQYNVVFSPSIGN
jgi:abhydrolase domain-containing protein 12